MWKFIRHEWNYWLKAPMLWIFLLIITLLVFGAVSSDQVQIGGGVGSVYKNAPSVIQSYYGVMSLIALLMTTAFMNATANRDFSTGMHQFIFTSPIKKRDYFFGKFIGAFTISIIPLLGVSLGALIGPLMPWVQPERYGPVIWEGHLQGLLSFAIPNTLIAGVILYSLAVVFRSNIVSFVGAMLILVFYVVSQGFTADLEKEWLANLLDPFGFQPLSTLSKYKTIDEKNLTATALEGQFLMNRLVWTGLSLLLLLVMYTRFSFNTKKEKVSKKRRKVEELVIQSIPKAKNFSLPDKVGFSWAAFWHMIVFETKAIIKNQTFMIIVLIGLINLIASLTSFTGNYGTARYPVTYDVIDAIRGSFYLFLIGIITFYSGVLVWKERDAKINEIQDATPSRTGMLFTSKLIGLLISLFVVLCCTILVGMIAQTSYGYTRYELQVYAQSLLVLDMFQFAYLVVIALLFHYLINNRYIAYFAFVAFIILNSFIWSVLELNSNMLEFGGTPFATYSDMNGYGPFIPGLVWFNLYWTFFSLILCVVIYAFFVRGKETGFKIRSRFALDRIKRQSGLLTVFGGLFILCAGFVYYNTEVLNTYLSPKETERRQKAYELAYKQYEDIAQPRWISLDYEIDIFPYDRDLITRVKGVIVNKSGVSIPAFHFTLPTLPDSLEIKIPGANLTLDDEKLNYRIYTLDKPMQAGDTMAIEVTFSKITKGFENSVSFTSLTQNGTFFNNSNILPSFGYNRNYEISDKNKRAKMDLPRRERLPRLDENNHKARSNTYISNDADWVDVNTVISTASDQIAVAPGSLIREWEEDGRRYFEYQLDKSSLNFYSFISARYEIAREKWQDIDLEVYYIKGHEYNVPNMLRSMEKSLEYYTENFGPYYHKQCRIIEFPRYSSFAQAFPGTMPYSEGIGFITDLRNVTEDDIDLVYYVVAHEMGHQYWAHQLIGASMRGTEMMSESFAQYSALMVMEKEYGRDKMKKFLRYEMNSYLNGRSGEFEAERPIMETENQGYIHYAKGSVVMYYLKEMIGEDQVNLALQKLIQEHAYQDPLYPTSISAVEAFREVTPDSLQYLISDLFENITLFSNRVMEATYVQNGETYEVTLKTFSEKFSADSLGKQSEIPLNDYVDVGIFAQTDAKKVLGNPLVYERIKISQAENTFTFTVNEKPHQAGIDPYNYLIDRLPEDNVKRISEE
ncbi:ABC transporter permease/M1 family aminopeptidase [Pararhodonellum marinum]|uniref:ABC transporter permease/M1 family aminopeptidase n=1 Tax=Pararhodonellum marinum TaxID=2755358 RepID=UPI00188FF01E|nr:M1 family aminopeptidase [Pararhodonellum marinum]